MNIPKTTTSNSEQLPVPEVPGICILRLPKVTFAEMEESGTSKENRMNNNSSNSPCMSLMDMSKGERPELDIDTSSVSRDKSKSHNETVETSVPTILPPMLKVGENPMLSPRNRTGVTDDNVDEHETKNISEVVCKSFGNDNVPNICASRTPVNSSENFLKDCKREMREGFSDNSVDISSNNVSTKLPVDDCCENFEQKNEKEFAKDPDDSKTAEEVFVTADTKSSRLSRQCVLNSQLLTQVTSFVKETHESNMSRTTEANGQDNDAAVLSDKIADVDETTCDSETFGISALFSDSFDKSYLVHMKNSKKPKKRKREETERKETVNKKKPRQAPPNYFLAVQISNPIIHKNVETVQKYMLEAKSNLRKALISVPTLHLTLMVMNLATKDDIAKAVKVLESCQPFINDWMREATLLDVSGISHFRDEVVFVMIPDENQVKWLQKLADHLTSMFRENGLPPSDNKGFKPHITMLKLSKAPQLRKKGVKKVTSKYYKPYQDSLFGAQSVETVQLCAMLKPKDSHGYYHVEHQIHCTTSVPLTPRDVPLLTAHKFTSSHMPERDYHTATRDVLCNTVTFNRTLQWLFIEGEKI